MRTFKKHCVAPASLEDVLGLYKISKAEAAKVKAKIELRNSIRKFDLGISLEDDELKKLIRFYLKLSNSLSLLGREFHFSNVEVGARLQKLLEYFQARKENKNS